MNSGSAEDSTLPGEHEAVFLVTAGEAAVELIVEEANLGRTDVDYYADDRTRTIIVGSPIKGETHRWLTEKDAARLYLEKGELLLDDIDGVFIVVILDTSQRFFSQRTAPRNHDY